MSNVINFDKIQTSTRKPGTLLEWNTKLAMNNLPTNRQKVLLLGQRLAASKDDGALFDVYSNQAVGELCGEGSIAHMMAVSAIKAYPNAALSMITVTDDPAAQAATGSIALSGKATKSGRINLKIANFEDINIAVEKDDEAAAVAIRLAEAVNANSSFPVTAIATEATIAVTAKNKGLIGNEIKLTCRLTSEGVTAQVTAMAGGDLNPKVTAALASIAAEGHDIIAFPFNDEDSLLALRKHLDAVAAPTEKRWAIGTFGHTGTLAEVITITKKINSEFESVAWYKDSASLSCELAAAYATVIASEEDPARPLNTLPLDGIGVPASKVMRTEAENALWNGVTPLETDATGTKALIVRAITTYTKSGNGTEDESMLDLTTVRTLKYASEVIDQRIKLRFPREKLNDKTPPRVRSEILDVLMKCEEAEILEHVEEHKDKLIVVRHHQNVGMVAATIPTDVVNGMHVFAGRIDLIL